MIPIKPLTRFGIRVPLNKFENIGIQGSFAMMDKQFLFTDRKQRVAIENTYSKCHHIKSRVCLGSILKSSNFAINVTNDIVTNINANS